MLPSCHTPVYSWIPGLQITTEIPSREWGSREVTQTESKRSLCSGQAVGSNCILAELETVWRYNGKDIAKY